MLQKTHLYLIFFVLASTLILSACQPQNNVITPLAPYPQPQEPAADAYPPPQNPTNPDEPVTSTDPTRPPRGSDLTGYEEQVYVDSIQINLMESFPLQVSATVDGNLPDGCTKIIGSKAEKVEDFLFQLHIYTERPKDVMCTQALVPFRETIVLDVYGLPAATYTVEGFGLEETFTFDVDNK
jgi:inhibitor of cysteine peptidase